MRVVIALFVASLWIHTNSAFTVVEGYYPKIRRLIAEDPDAAAILATLPRNPPPLTIVQNVLLFHIFMGLSQGNDLPVVVSSRRPLANSRIFRCGYDSSTHCCTYEGSISFCLTISFGLGLILAATGGGLINSPEAIWGCWVTDRVPTDCSPNNTYAAHVMRFKEIGLQFEYAAAFFAATFAATALFCCLPSCFLSGIGCSTNQFYLRRTLTLDSPEALRLIAADPENQFPGLSAILAYIEMRNRRRQPNFTTPDEALHQGESAFNLARYLDTHLGYDPDFRIQSGPFTGSNLLQFAVNIQDLKSLSKIIAMLPEGPFSLSDQQFLNQSKILVQVAKKGDIQLLTQLLNRGLDVNAKGENGFTALTAAVSFLSGRERVEVVELLIARGADLSVAFPSEAAAEYRNKTVQDILSGKYGVHELQFIPSRIHLVSAKEREAFLLQQFKKGDEDSFIAACHESMDFDRLIAEYAPGYTALTWAYDRGYLKFAAFLLEHGYSPIAPGYDGLPPLYFAATNADASCVDTLVPKLKEYVLHLSLRELVEFEALHISHLTPKLNYFRKFLSRQKYLLASEERFREAFDQHREESPHAEGVDADLACPECGEDLADIELAVGKGPADCSCVVYCGDQDCLEAYAKKVLRMEVSGPFLCPDCAKPISVNFLRRAGVDGPALQKFLEWQVAQYNLSQPGFRFCRNAKGPSDCRSGRVVRPSEKSYRYACNICQTINCLLCGLDHRGECDLYAVADREWREIIRVGALAPGEDPHPMCGKVRPCYHCGEWIYRFAGCNHMVCQHCKQKWHWNLGKEQSGGNSDRMRYTPLVAPP